MFSALVALTFVSTIACMAALELTSRKLPTSFAEAQAERRREVDELMRRQPWILYAARFVIFGYLATLVALGWDVPGAKYALALLSIAWTGVSTLHAPNVQHRVAVPLYELCLVLNGAVLASAYLR